MPRPQIATLRALVLAGPDTPQRRAQVEALDDIEGEVGRLERERDREVESARSAGGKVLRVRALLATNRAKRDTVRLAAFETDTLRDAYVRGVSVAEGAIIGADPSNVATQEEQDAIAAVLAATGG